ncbi:hypothetical protein B0H67DRAFT_640886 [Lasiosphaeris hirsuta]|uniref:Uncharacterized protein n=1 Tax=Lasiosphaeris hirsuta TaxID=260670 RepID=A0AA40E557_9PEZI|nr:hypothetical protein B0H67DRAFT_640886 [Lasiosphaeris hirsuta]
MRPLTFQDADPEYLKDRLLLLNRDFAAIHYVGELLARNGTGGITSTRGGLTLPIELWQIILDLLAYTGERLEPSHSNYSFVKASLVAPGSTSPLPTGAEKTLIVRCVRHEFKLEPGEKLASNLINPNSIDDFEDFLDDATPERAAKINEASDKVLAELDDEDMTHDSCVKIPPLLQLSGPGNVFYICLHEGGSSYELVSRYPHAGLYCDVEAPDVISRIDHGSCWITGNGRFLCPGGRCSRGAKEVFWWEHLGCGIYLSCPLCSMCPMPYPLNALPLCPHKKEIITDTFA